MNKIKRFIIRNIERQKNQKFVYRDCDVLIKNYQKLNDDFK